MPMKIPAQQRSRLAPFTLPDEQLEYWAEIYLELPGPRRRGVSFEQFLAATPQVRDAPLLLEQLAVRSRLDELGRTAGLLGERQRHAIDALERQGACCANGRVVEKLRHRRHPRSNRDFIPQS